MQLSHSVSDEHNKINIIEEDKKVEYQEDKSKNVSNEPNSSNKASTTSKEIFDLYNMIKKDEQIEKPKEEIDETQTQKIADLIFQDLEFNKSDDSTKEKVDEVLNNRNNYNLAIKEEETVKNTNEMKTEENEKQPEINTDRIPLNTKNLLANSTGDLNRTLSNNSIASTLTNKSQHHQQAQIPDWVKENAHVIVSTNSVMNKPGYIRFIGPAKFNPEGIWIGVELEQPFGKNDGSLKGVTYFKCPENRGVFVRADKLSLVVNKVDS